MDVYARTLSRGLSHEWYFLNCGFIKMLFSLINCNFQNLPERQLIRWSELTALFCTLRTGILQNFSIFLFPIIYLLNLTEEFQLIILDWEEVSLSPVSVQSKSVSNSLSLFWAKISFSHSLSIISNEFLCTNSVTKKWYMRWLTALSWNNSNCSQLLTD